MIVLFGSHGSPGATTTAFLTAYYISQMQEVPKALFVEADPSGGTLPTLLGLDADPGLVSLLTSTTTSLDIHKHVQKISSPKMNKLEILCPPYTIRGSWDTSRMLGSRITDFVKSVEPGMPVVVDGGRIFFSSPMSSLITSQALVAVVIREGYLPALPVLNYMKEVADAQGARAGIISVGSPIWSDREYQDNTGLELLGNIDEHPKNYVDLTEFRGSPRGDKKFHQSIQNLATSLYRLSSQ